MPSMRTAQLRARFGKKISLLAKKFLNSKLTSSEPLRRIGTGKKLAWKCQKGCFKQISEKLFLSLSRRNQPKAKTCPRKKVLSGKGAEFFCCHCSVEKPLLSIFLSERPKSSECRKLLSLSSFSLFSSAQVGPGHISQI